MIKIAKGVDPKGKSFVIASMGDGGVTTWHTYNVLKVTGVKNFAPTVDSTVHLEYDFERRSENACAPFLAIPLEDFIERVNLKKPRIMPVGKIDIFWT